MGIYLTFPLIKFNSLAALVASIYPTLLSNFRFLISLHLLPHGDTHSIGSKSVASTNAQPFLPSQPKKPSSLWTISPRSTYFLPPLAPFAAPPILGTSSPSTPLYLVSFVPYKANSPTPSTRFMPKNIGFNFPHPNKPDSFPVAALVMVFAGEHPPSKPDCTSMTGNSKHAPPSGLATA